MNIKKEVRQHLTFSTVQYNLLPRNTLLALLHETDNSGSHNYSRLLLMQKGATVNITVSVVPLFVKILLECLCSVSGRSHRFDL